VESEALTPPERAKHTPRHASSKAKGFFRRFWWAFLTVPLVFVLSVTATLYVAYRQIELPETLPPIRTSYLFDRNGEVLTSLHGAVDRKIVPLSQISENLRNAVLATEDAGFYTHPGIDVQGIVSAAWTDLVKRDAVAGASTITQQLVKNVYAGQYIENPDGSREYVVPPRSIKEKVREALLAIKLEQELGKDQILAKYLNTVYFGHGAYGAEAAAQTYFGIAASELDVSQSAVLAAVLHAPSLYDPIKSTFDNEFRRDYTLDQMAKYGYISADEAAQRKNEPCCGIPETQQDAQALIDSRFGSEYFIDYTREYLFDQYGSARVYGSGLQITTSLDMGMQRAAQRIVTEHLPDTDYNPDASLVTIDNETGEVLAMVGGRDWETSKVNLATQPCEGCGQQAGSAFKVFTLAAALEQDFSLGAWWQGPSVISIPDDECDTAGVPWQPVNAGDGSAGTFTLLGATQHSVNTVYAQLVTQLDGGPNAVVEMADRLGIKSKLDPFCSITLGSVAVNPLEMTNAYATIANHGYLNRATPIKEIARPNGEVFTRTQPTKKEPVLDPNIADQVTYALRSVVTSGTGYAANLEYPYFAYGKTGTGQDNVAAWFCGYTQEISTCVWVGYPKDPQPLLNIEGVSAVYGGTIPAAIWQEYMQLVMKEFYTKGGDPYPTPELTGYKGPAVVVYSPTPPPPPSPSQSETPEPTDDPSPSDEPSPTDDPPPE
jgi:penicillin-binding protein 1A